MTCKAEDLRQIPLLPCSMTDEMAVLTAQVEIKKICPAPTHLQDWRTRQTCLRDVWSSAGDDCGPGSPGGAGG